MNPSQAGGGFRPLCRQPLGVHYEIVLSYLLVEVGEHILHKRTLVGLSVPALLHDLGEVRRAVVGNLWSPSLKHVERHANEVASGVGLAPSHHLPHHRAGVLDQAQATPKVPRHSWLVELPLPILNTVALCWRPADNW